MTVVYVPTPLRRLTGGRGKVEVEGTTVSQVLDALERAFPGMRAELRDDGGGVRGFINVFVNGTEIRQLQGIDTPVAGEDEVSIIPAMAGGTDLHAADATLTLSGQALPDLRIVPRDAVHLHEDADPGRVERLSQRLRHDGVLRNPPAAAPLPDGGFVVLDGANRTRALARLGVPVLPLQIVAYDDPGVRLDVWRHLIVEPLDVGAALRERGLRAEDVPVAEAARRLDDRTIAAYVLTGGQALAIPLSPERRLATILAQVVAAYKGRARIYRVPTADLEALSGAYGSIAAVAVFPRLTKPDILEIAGSPAKLPTGITRHLIPGRALRVNVPLEALGASDDLAAKNRWLAGFVRRRLLDHSVRYYPEGTFLFDE